MSTRITYLGHSTVHIESGDLSLLTDPVFCNRFFWMRRQETLPFKPEEIKPPSVIFISQAHYDHLDISSFKYFSAKIPVVAPFGLGKFVSKFIQNPVIEVKTGDTLEIQTGIRVTGFAVNHRSFRLSGLGYRESMGYWIDLHGKKIFFTGDTAYREDFKQFQNTDIALVPIEPCRPQWLMRPWLMTSDEIIRLLQDLNAKVTIPIHWHAHSSSWPPSLRALQDQVRILKCGEFVDSY